MSSFASDSSASNRSSSASSSSAPRSTKDDHSSRTTSYGSQSSAGGSSSQNDFDHLKNEIGSLKDMVSDFVSKRTNEAVETAEGLASQVGTMASDIAGKGADLATAATDQAKTFASELERVGRANPLAAIGGALVVGVMIGLIGRGRG